MAKPSAISRFLSKKSILDVDFAIILMSNSCHTCMSSWKVSGYGQNQCHDDLESTHYIPCAHTWYATNSFADSQHLQKGGSNCIDRYESSKIDLIKCRNISITFIHVSQV